LIVLTRLDGRAVALNTDLIERIEEQCGSVVTLVGGAQYPVAESVQEVAALVREYRVSVLLAVKREEVGSRRASLRLLPAAPC
jgi:flagellar protein FlbD